MESTRRDFFENREVAQLPRDLIPFVNRAKMVSDRNRILNEIGEEDKNEEQN